MAVLDEFKKFIARGNFFDLAVGIVIGAAFGTVVNSLVKDILMPPIGLLTSGADFSELYINLSGEEYESLAEATQAGAATINYGQFINNVIAFLIVATVIFLLVRSYNEIRERHSKAPAPAAPTDETCRFCKMTVPNNASRCPHCTSDLSEEPYGR